ncbi:hypothetical protein [Microbacterium sp.]|uniref:hypothetical protein n=1 Tax=Microbacterium sp. TaxID=51671 RepID=UPI002E36CFE9|nr:hypothetical protein [Microbacterium sp.]HEX5728316.1 hypothetical protein [Microbacterium sp.]
MPRIKIVVNTPISESVLSLIPSRFSSLTISPRPSADAAEIVGEMDQAAERALLTLLWDTGHDVISMQTIPSRNNQTSTTKPEAIRERGEG